jgi:hypothetical protein
MDQALREKVKGISSYKDKAVLLGAENVLFDRSLHEGVAILDGLKEIKYEDLERGEPISIDLKIQDGRVVAIR